MTTSRVIVPWREGLHLRTAVKLVHLAQSFRSSIQLSYCGQVANLRSIMSIVSLCAVMGATLDLEVVGDDEQAAVTAIEQVFNTPVLDVG